MPSAAHDPSQLSPSPRSSPGASSDTYPESTPDVFDTVIIGGGAAGLTAAIYLARFRRKVLLIDAGGSRLQSIPRSRNYPGFPEGIVGTELLARLREQAAMYGIEALSGTATELEKTDDRFIVHWQPAADSAPASRAAALCVVLATGVEDVKPSIARVEDGVRNGYIHYCPICDAYEVRGKKVCVLTDGRSGVYEALYLRHFTDRLTLINLEDKADLREQDIERLAAAGVRTDSTPITGIRLRDAALKDEHASQAEPLHVKDDDTDEEFDAAYCALGTRVRSGLARELGAECDEDGYLVTDRKQRTSIDGLYAIGDVAEGVNQIAVAAGHAAIATSAIHLSLNGMQPWAHKP